MHYGLYTLFPLLAGWIADKLWGDPTVLPHPVAGFGKLISMGEKALNKGKGKAFKGALFALILIAAAFGLIALLLKLLHPYPWLSALFSAVTIFFCLAGTTLIKEVRQVFAAVAQSPELGRRQVARIVGRDTATLSPQQIRTAALETLSENLSDGVITPLFWFMLLGVPGMFAYKMVNTLDSMIGYKNERYRQFGCWAARIDDIANYLPARLTALLMLLVSGKLSLLPYVKKYGRRHTSPNSGYPEAALSGILQCRFGGPNSYFGKTVDKPYIGDRDKELTSEDLETAVRTNQKAEAVMILLAACCTAVLSFPTYPA